MKPEEKTVTLYACGVDWQHELGEGARPDCVLCESLELLAAARGCTKDCGIVKLKARLTLEEWVAPQNLRGVSDE